MKAVVLLSGGMDSTTALGQAIHDGAKSVLAVTARYGSLHESAETRAANDVVQYYKPFVEHCAVEIPDVIFKGGHSALLGESNMPNEEYHDLEKESPSSTVVPFRNAVLISLAVAVAEARQYDRVYLAVHATDALGFAYPDCTPEFVGAMTASAYIGTFRKVRLFAPFQWMTKGEIVARAAWLGAPLHLTWSCYRGGELACGQCPTCLERISAFKEARFIDPIQYSIPIQWELNMAPFRPKL